MLRFTLMRLVYSVVVVVATTVLVFALSHMTGDPRSVFMNEYTTKEDWDAWGREMGLDKPLVVQYGIWLGKAVRGDLGDSLRERRPARTVIAQRVAASLQLALGSFIFAIGLGVPLGVLSAMKRGGIWDYVGRTIAVFGQALPPFWLGVNLMLIFSVLVRWLPTSGRGGIDHYILPSITLGWLTAAGLLRLTRSAMLDVLDSEYVKFARAKGVREWLVVWKHAFRNAMIAPLTFGGLILASFLTGAVVTETVFAWPGMGRLAVQSVYNNDFPVLTGVVLVFTVIYVGMNFMIDIAYSYVDPRIRY